MTGQTLIFCVGAAKSGTSWLHDYLYDHDEVYLHRLKELHYFDVLDNGGSTWHRRQQEARLGDVRKRLAGLERPEENKVLPTLITDIEDWLEIFDGETPVDQAYLDYVGIGRSGAKVVGDFTPAYALLSETMLTHMAAMADKVRFLFVMREPVDRLWSNIRMNVGTKGEDALEREVEKYLADDQRELTMRSNYRRTLNRLQSVLPPEALHLEFYERLFSQEAIDRICGFLGIAPKPAKFDKVVHKGRNAPLDSETRALLQASLKPQYNHIEKLMGTLPSEWTERMVSA